MTESVMTSNKPYLLRAFYEWIVDNDLTPYILVDTSGKDVVVPEQFISENKITLNIAPRAVAELDVGNAFVMFNARFNGSPMQVEFPVESVLAIYARENEQGMVFPIVQSESQSENDGELSDDKQPSATISPITVAAKKKKPTLTVVK